MPNDKQPDSRGHTQKHGPDRRYTVEQCADALRKAHGIMTVAAGRLGCTSKTLKRYIDWYPELLEVREACTERLIDLAEGKLFQKINEGNMTAIIFTLKCKAKDRGYVERGHIEISGKLDTGPDMSQVSDDVLEASVSRIIRGEVVSAGQGDQ